MKDYFTFQCAKKVVSASPGLVDASEFCFSLARRASDVFSRNSKNRRTVKSILLVKKFLGLVEMTSGLVNASFSLPEWQAVGMILTFLRLTFFRLTFRF